MRLGFRSSLPCLNLLGPESVISNQFSVFSKESSGAIEMGWFSPPGTELAAAKLHSCSRFGAGRGGAKVGVEVSLEGIEARGNSLAGRKFGGDGVGGLQAVAGDAHNRCFVLLEAILGDESLLEAGGHAARGFGEDAFGFGKQLDGGDDLGIRDIF